MATLSVGGTTVFDGSALQSGVTVADMSNFTFPAGHIVQIQSHFSSTGYTVSSNNAWQDATAWEIEIKPSSTSNKIFYMLNTAVQSRYTGAGGSGAALKLRYKVDSGSLGDVASTVLGGGEQSHGDIQHKFPYTNMFVHAPATTGTITYRPQYREIHSNTDAWFGTHGKADLCDGTWIVAVEFIPSP